MNPRQVGVATSLALSLLAAPAAAATWVAPRTTPSLAQIVAIDATGEPQWPGGAEDVAGDGLAVFKVPEQSVDIRTAYAATDMTRFWVRVYVSSAGAPSMGDSVYVFLDTDDNPATGGLANEAGVDPKLTTDPTKGGYEYVLGIRGGGTISNIWQWNALLVKFVAQVPPVGKAAAEVGIDTDPILLDGAKHGYVQASVDLSILGLTSACTAKLFIRSADDSGIADLDVQTIEPCVPVDGNNDGVPDVVPVPATCTTDAECPGGGICVKGACVEPFVCVLDSDCKTTEQCTNDRCVPKPGGPCKANADCGALVCANMVCTACTPGGTECGAGMRCGPLGRCVEDPNGSSSSSSGSTSSGSASSGSSSSSGGVPVNPGDEVQGGACACTLLPRDERENALGVLLGLGLAAMLRVRRSRRDARKGS
jgi:uncharacterized membrane protein YgcG